jgi:hypothetical protein
MPSTKPVTPQEFWPLFEAWARVRIPPGVLWLPQGWSDWAISDFQAYLLTQAAVGGGEPVEGFDVSRSAHLLIGGDRLAFLLNRDSPQAQKFLMCLVAQSAHQSSADFVQQIQRDQLSLSEGKLDGAVAAAQPVILALVLDNAARAKLQSQQMQLHFTTDVQTSSGAASNLRVSVLSQRIARNPLGASLPSWPETSDASTAGGGRPFASLSSGGSFMNSPPGSAGNSSPFNNIFGNASNRESGSKS